MKSLLTKGALLLAALVGLSAQALAYTHPGAPLTLSDLQVLKANVDQGRQPWKSGYDALAADYHSSPTYGMWGPYATVGRAPDVNLNGWRQDMIAIGNLARMWYFTGNTAYAQKAHDILLAYANTHTAFSGNEAGLDVGDYAWRFVGGADILRGTWPGWTDADTTTVKAYFGNVVLPVTSTNGDSMFGAANKGALGLVAGGLIAIFNDDTARLDSIVYQVRTLAHIGLRSSNDIGVIGDSHRDQGHAHGQLFSLAMLAEALWKQGIDIYSEYNNRLLADGEYFARQNDFVTTPFLPFGTTDQYYISDWGTFGWGGGNTALNILHGAYVVRKGLPAPYIARRLQGMEVSADSFMFLKEADPSTATPAAALAIPTTTSITSGFTDVEIGGATPTGVASYSGGTWTVQGGGAEMWGDNDSCHFTYKAVTGDCAIIAKVNSVQNTSLSAKAGVMIRSTLSPGAPRVWMAVTPRIQFEQNLKGIAVYGGANYGNKAYDIGTPTASYWVKVERLGNIITGYVSPDGTNWAATDVGRVDAPVPATWYVGLVVCSVANGTLNTSTFSNVQITTGNGGAPIVTPAAPAALLASPGENAVPLRWQPSFGAASYTVKRGTASGGPYSTTVASGITASSYTDTTVASGTTYYYVVTATNSAGTSGNSPEDSAKPVSPMVNVAFGGTATANIADNGGTEAPVKAFDRNPNTKWLGWVPTGALQYDFGAGNALVVKRYTINSADVAARDPKDWQFQGSNDGSAWTTLDTQSNQSFVDRLRQNLYNIGNTTAYRYYRLNITANNGDGSVTVAEFGLWSDTGRTLPDGTYVIVNKKSNKVLDVYNGGTGDGANVDQWGWSGGNNQKWTLTHLGNGQYQAVGVASGKLLEVAGASTANGANVQIWPSNNNNCQKWTVIPAGNGNYKLLNVNSGKAVDVSGGSTADGANVLQWPYGGGDNQQWRISIAP